MIVRKTRTSVTDSALVTYEEKVLPERHECLNGPKREQRHIYRYRNGSEVVVGGLDNPSKTLSTEFDLIYVQEAIELSENDWEMLTRPLRNGVMPFQQIIADTNPDRDTHWLKNRCDRGATFMLESRHEDNPVMWDSAAGRWTEFGASYIATLDRLTGVRKQRLRYGRWVAAEGMVYDGWDRSIHLVDRFTIPREWRRFWVVDFGFTNPFCWQAWAEDGDGRLYRYREVYHTRRLVSDHCDAIRKATDGEPLPVAVICDHDAEDRATFERELGVDTIAATKDVSPGIQAVQKRLRVDDDGRARLFLLRDSLVERDEALDEKSLPCCSEEEVDGYVWDQSNGRKRGEEPVKERDHGMDAIRYVVAHLDLRAPRTPVVLYEL